MPTRTKHSIDQLAILGGEPIFAEPLHVGRPNIGNRKHFLRRVDEILDSRWLTNDGPFVRDFEAKLSQYLGVPHVIATANGTLALEIAIRGMGLAGEVILPAFTFAATAHALKWQGLTPVFCDIDRASHTIDPASVEQLITPRTSAILGVHTWGHACAIDELSAIAGQHGLALLFDGAHAFGCTYRRQMIGRYGGAETFSFHATKVANSFEGGAITTNDDELAHKLRLLRNFGFAGYDNVESLGINGKMSEIAAAMGLTSLESINEFINANRRNLEQYHQMLTGLPGIAFAEERTDRSNNHYVVAEIDTDAAGISRDELVDVLWAENVRARRYFYPGCHRMEPYCSLPEYANVQLPVTDEVAARVILFPTGTAVDTGTIERVCELVRFVLSNGPDVASRLRG